MKQIHLFLKKFLRFFTLGLRFRILLTLETLSYPNPLSAILEDFFSIRFKTHQVLSRALSGMMMLRLYLECSIYLVQKMESTTSLVSSNDF